MILLDDPIMHKTIEAIHRYHDAQALDSTAQEVERLRVLAESLFKAIADFNLQTLGHPAESWH
ncbi:MULTISPECIES: hypothetical protein [Pseudomonas]|uniref:hypothetical protein n=1 Tax=Pseudomonas TaxID=286 RepID=UPI0005AB3C08|nr:MULTISPECIES: hypothetical protein [Pseudomonas]KAB0532755.1 hypothetical protein F7R16_10940 [Pseudomonas chlororaphis subsp. aureofaciens]TSD26057.1 hypothetical protein FCE86_031850 [Pseudomonas sp. ATCC 13985]WDG57887.1 hypothetical protein PUP52_18750 [Pseudomonas chlororaphis]WDG64100.1 hypothetical protein PUP59_18755 [Pseudomonas chlororaphis]